MTDARLQLVTTRLASLTARVVDVAADVRSGAPDLVVVLCHGYGAPGTDLVGLSAELCEVEPALFGRVRFVFPEAPLSLDMAFGARAWWHIDVGRFQRAAMGSGDIGSLQQEVPEGLPASRKALMAAVDEMSTQWKVPMSRFVLGGFSQGAMLATDVTLRGDEAPAALAILSGTLICKDEWLKLAPRRRGLRVLQSHGTHDPLLPFAAARDLHDMLSSAGLDVKFVSFPGGHGIDGEVIDGLARLLVAALPAVVSPAGGGQP